jgi:mycothiol synthase
MMERPNFLPARDVFLAESSTKKVVGFSVLNLEPGIGRVIIDCFVCQLHRRQGWGERLLKRSSQRARDAGIEKMQAAVDASHGGGGEFLSQMGFAPVRRYLQLEIDLSRVKLPVPAQIFKDKKLKLDKFSGGQESDLTEIQNTIFRDSWGFCPNSEADISYFLKLTGTRLQDILVLYTENENVRAGYLWPHIIDDDPASLSLRKRGRIHMCGILKEFQGRGWGRFLVTSGLHRLRRQGLQSIALTVDSQNASAVALYKSLGFITKTQEIWYELSLRGTE